MGLAERFKDKLAKKDIFTKNNEEINNENYVSKPITQNITVQPKTLHSGVIEPVSSILELPQIDCDKFEDLESEIIDKIRKTPYWEEYSTARQEKFKSYFWTIEIIFSAKSDSHKV
jgi:hypothetical protein